MKDHCQKDDGEPSQIRHRGSDCNVEEVVVTNQGSAANLKHTTRDEEFVKGLGENRLYYIAVGLQFANNSSQK